VTSLKNPDAMVSKAAYLLFYRRRSVTPLGGPRFREIMERFDTRSEEDESTESGEGQRLVVGSSLTGSSSAGIGAEAIRHVDRGLVSSATTAIIARHDDDLPSYSRLEGETIQTSIEDEGVEMSDGFPNHSGSSVAAAQQTNWTFANLTASSNNYATAAEHLSLDYASDDAQGGSTGDERDPDDVLASGPDIDTQMDFGDGPYNQYVEPSEPSGYTEPPAPDNVAQATLSNIAHHTWARHQVEQVMTVPGPLDADQRSEDGAVAEILLDEHDSPKLD
jgi:ubiquitin carboxyl-terminal hydrolase 4/11